MVVNKIKKKKEKVEMMKNMLSLLEYFFFKTIINERKKRQIMFS